MKMERSEFLASILAVGLAVGGCGSKAKKETAKEDEEDDEEERKRKKKKKKKDEEEDEPSKKESKSKPTADSKNPDPAPTAGAPDLAAIFGTQADGFTPRVFAKLKEDMSPEEAGKIIAGSDKVNEFGFAEIKTGVPAGVKQLTLNFQDKKLKFAEILFPKSVSNDAFWDKLVAHLKAKLAPVEMKELEPGQKNMMWIGPGFHSITLRPKISMDDDDGYEVSYAVI